MGAKSLERIVIVGASLAGVNAATTLRDEGFDGELVIVGGETERPYDRPPLSKEVLAGEMSAGDFDLPIPDDLGAEWRLGQLATGLDVDRRRLLLGSDDLAFDGLLIATGSAPRRLDGVIPDTERIFELRTVGDSFRLRDAMRRAQRMIIIGSGFIGIEVASTARAAGLEVTLVSIDPPLAAGGPMISTAVEEMLRRNDVTLYAPMALEGVRRRGDTVHVEVADGLLLEADIAVVAAGAVPQVDWLEGSGIPLDNGVRCENTLRVEGFHRIAAAGDVARWPNPLFGGLSMRIEHWSNAAEQGSAAARTLLDERNAVPFSGLPTFWSDHFGSRLQSVGLVRLAERFEVVDGDWPSTPFAAKGLRGESLVAGIAYGMPRAMLPFRRTLRDGVHVDSLFAAG